MLHSHWVVPDPLVFAAGERGDPPLAITAELLAEHYAHPVHRFAAMVTRNSQDSADLAQEALVRALRLRHRYDPQRGTFEAWLWRIVVNVARDAGRAARRHRFLLDRLAARPAEKARVSNPYLSQLERGMYQPSAHVLRSIAGALGLNPGMMFTLAGFLDDESQERSQPSVEQAISLDPRLSTEQKRALITIYRSFLAGTG